MYSNSLHDADKVKFAKEYWTGDSRDGRLENGDGYHFYRLTEAGCIVEAYEFYETEDGNQVVSPLPEMQNVDWFKDLGFNDYEALDFISQDEFEEIRNLVMQQ